MADSWVYEIHGTAARGQTWRVDGVIDNCDFVNTFHVANLEAFKALTEGKAVYGSPGLGCNGPYKITRLVIDKKELVQ